MADYKLQAIRTFEGNEGIVRRGDVFKVDSKERADLLQRLELAEKADSGAEVTQYAQMKEELSKKKKDELAAIAEAEGVTYKEGATKEEMNSAILTKRETDYLTGKATEKNNGAAGLAGSIAGSGASGGIAAGGTTGGTTTAGTAGTGTGSTGSTGTAGSTGAAGTAGGSV